MLDGRLASSGKERCSPGFSGVFEKYPFCRLEIKEPDTLPATDKRAVLSRNALIALDDKVADAGLAAKNKAGLERELL